MSMTDEATIRIFRFDSTRDKEPRYDSYKVPVEIWINRKVIDVLRYIYEHFAPELSFRESCHQQLCGVCAMMVNKKISLGM